MVPAVANHTVCLEGIQKDILSLGQICSSHKQHFMTHGRFIQTKVERECMLEEDRDVGADAVPVLEESPVSKSDSREVPTLAARASYGAPLFDQYWYICEMFIPGTLNLCKALNSTDVTRIFEITAKRGRDITNVDKYVMAAASKI